METVFLLMVTSYVALTGAYETRTEDSFPTLAECVEAGTLLVTDLADQLTAAGAEGAVWFHCTQAQGRVLGQEN
jgi:hypothetical protein